MSGRIGLLDNRGGGSVFWFEVVLPYASAAVTEPARTTPCRVAQPAATRRGRILLAEDNDINIEVARLVLQGAGYTVDVAINGIEAVDAVRCVDYDLVLMDMQMPVLDGVSATREVRAMGRAAKRLPIVAMTANAMKEDEQRCLEAGMNDYITKPIAPLKLLATVARWIDAVDGRQRHDVGDPLIAALPVIEYAYIEALEAVFPADKIRSLFQSYLDGNKEYASELSRLKDSPASGGVGPVAHKIVSTSGLIGARQLQTLATKLQDACHKGEDAAVTDLTASIIAAFTTVETVLLERMSEVREVA